MRRLFANLLYLVLGLPLALSALVLFAVRPWAADRQFYRRIVDDDRLYAALASPEVAKKAPDVLQIDGASFDGHLLVSAIQKHAPTAEIKAFGDGVVNRAFDSMEAGNASHMLVDLRPIKTAFLARGPAVAADYAAALPSRPGAPAVADLTWRPASVTVATETATVAAALKGAIDAMPDTVSPGTPGVADRPAGAPRLTRSALGRGAITLAALSALLISGLAYLGAGSAGRRLAKAGRMVLWPSLIVLAGGIFLSLPGGLAASGLIPAGAKHFLGGAAGSALAGYLGSVLGGVAEGFFVAGLIGASLGGVLISTRRFVEPREIE